MSTQCGTALAVSDAQAEDPAFLQEVMYEPPEGFDPLVEAVPVAAPDIVAPLAAHVIMETAPTARRIKTMGRVRMDSAQFHHHGFFQCGSHGFTTSAAASLFLSLGELRLCLTRSGVPRGASGFDEALGVVGESGIVVIERDAPYDDHPAVCPS